MFHVIHLSSIPFHFLDSIPKSATLLHHAIPFYRKSATGHLPGWNFKQPPLRRTGEIWAAMALMPGRFKTKQCNLRYGAFVIFQFPINRDASYQLITYRLGDYCPSRITNWPSSLVFFLFKKKVELKSRTPTSSQWKQVCQSEGCLVRSFLSERTPPNRPKKTSSPTVSWENQGGKHSPPWCRFSRCFTMVSQFEEIQNLILWSEWKPLKIWGKNPIGKDRKKKQPAIFRGVCCYFRGG